MSCIFFFSSSLPELNMTFMFAVKASVESYDASQITKYREYHRLSCMISISRSLPGIVIRDGFGTGRKSSRHPGGTGRDGTSQKFSGTGRDDFKIIFRGTGRDGTTFILDGTGPGRDDFYFHGTVRDDSICTGRE